MVAQIINNTLLNELILLTHTHAHKKLMSRLLGTQEHCMQLVS